MLSRLHQDNQRNQLQRKLLFEPLEQRALLATFIADPMAADGEAGSPRSIVIQVNTNGEDDEIILPQGEYLFSLAGSRENSSQSGDLDFTEAGTSVTIRGQGAGNTFLNAAGLDRVLHVHEDVALNLVDVTIAGGNAFSGFDPDGGGILNEGGTVSLSRVSVVHNFAFGHGGGISNAGSMMIMDSRIGENSAEMTGGGGIGNRGTLQIRRSLVENNEHGGIDNDEYILMDESAIIGNSGRFGGGLAMGTLAHGSLRNVVVSGNSGAGIYNGGYAHLEMRNCTVTDNVGDQTSPGGIANAWGAPVVMLNTIVAGNHSLGENPDLGTEWHFVSEGHNLIGVAVGVTGLIDGEKGDQVGTPLVPIDPLLAPLADNGGPTPTHALLPGSPAIDAGTEWHSPVFDQRDVVRPQGGAFDIGSFELQATAAVLAGSDLVVLGTSGRDRINTTYVGDQLLVRVNRDQFYFDNENVDRIVVHADDGNDVVRLSPRSDTPSFVDGGRGDDWIFAGQGDDLLRGGAGRDVLWGGSGDDILLGGDGNDWLFGGAGRDILIGGADFDWLSGGSGEDIVIGGTTGHDARDESLRSILSEWRTDQPVATRKVNLSNGGGLNGNLVLVLDQTVFDDGVIDRVLGKTDDWLFV